MYNERKNNRNVYGSVLLHAVVLTTFLAASTVVFHEMGHFAVGSAMDCRNVEINLLTKEYDTYTSMSCPVKQGGFEHYALLLSGFAFILPLAALLHLVRGHERYYAHVILGFNLIISAFDFSLVVPAASYASVIAGFLIFVYGENAITSTYMLNIRREFLRV